MQFVTDTTEKEAVTLGWKGGSEEELKTFLSANLEDWFHIQNEGNNEETRRARF